MATIGQLVIDLRADNARLSSDLRKAERSLRSSVAKQKRYFRSLEKSARQVRKAVGAIGISFGAVAFAQSIKRVAGDMDSLNNTARKLGIGVEKLQELRFAGEEVGVTANTTDMALQRLTRRIGEAAQGTGELKGTLDLYNIAVRDAEGRTRSTEAVLGDLADAIMNAESEQEQLRIAFKAFDSEGAALVSMLKRGSIGLQEFMQRARDLGVVIDTQTVKKLAMMNREIEIFQQRASVLYTEALGGAATLGNAFSDALFGDEVEKERARLILYEKVLENTIADLERLSIFPDKLQDLKQKLVQVQAEIEAIQSGSKYDLDTPIGPRPETFNVQEYIDGLKKVAKEETAVAQLRADFANEDEHSIQTRLRLLEVMNKLQEEGVWGLDADQYNDLVAALGELAAAERRLDDIETAAREAAAAEEAAKQAAEDWGRALNDVFVDAIFNARSFGDILDALARKMATSLLFGQDGTGGLLGGFTSSLGGSFANLFDFRAHGGPVSARSPYIVGEQGPELFLPSGSGYVVPNHMLDEGGGGSGSNTGGPPMVNQNFNINTPDADSFGASQRQVERQMFLAGNRAFSRG